MLKLTDEKKEILNSALNKSVNRESRNNARGDILEQWKEEGFDLDHGKGPMYSEIPSGPI